jgi:hypothetical protein
MACDGNDYVTNFRDGVLILEDGAGHSLETPLEMGDVAISGLSADMTELAVYKSRGRTKAVRKTNDVEASISFSAMLQRLGSESATKPALLDFMLKRGLYKHNLRTSHVCGDSYLLTARWQLTVPEGVDYIELRGVSFSADTAEGDPNTISCTGTVYDPDVVIVRAA